MAAEKDSVFSELTGRKIPDATVGRLPLYLRCITELPESKVNILSEELAELAGVTAAKVRKDFSFIGFAGTRGHGYSVDQLRSLIRRELGLTEEWTVALVGVGNLGLALANYRGLSRRGFSISALFDNDEEKIGTKVGDLTVEPVSKIREVVTANNITMGVVTTPPQVAQNIVDVLVASGVTSILNFAPTTVSAPAGVTVRKVDLALELQVLGYYSKRSSEEADALVGDSK